MRKPLEIAAEHEYKRFLIRRQADQFHVDVRELTPDEERDLSGRFERAGRKLKSLRNETWGAWNAKAQALAIEKATLVLRGSPDLEPLFPVGVRDEFAKEACITLDADGVARLPEVWTPEIKTAILRRFPKLVDAVCNLTDSMTQFEAEEEAVETKSFR